MTCGRSARRVSETPRPEWSGLLRTVPPGPIEADEANRRGRAPVTQSIATLRAKRALATAGFPADLPLERASSVTNEVWLTPDAVLRVNTRPDQRLRREAIIASTLPDGLGYPPVLAYGGDLGGDWLIVERVRGRPLSRCWPTMGDEARREAVHQLADRLRLLHSFVPPNLPALQSRPQLLDPARLGSQAVVALVAGLRKAAGLPRVEARVMGDLERLVVATSSVLDPFDAPTLVHGDLTFENILWDSQEQRISAFLDFEWSRTGPADLDLDVLLRCVAYPELHVAADYEHLTRAVDYSQVPWWLAESYPELFSFPSQLERVRLYSIAWDVQELLRFPPSGPVTDLHPAHPYHRLVRTLRGTSYLDEMHRGVARTPA